MSFENEPQYQEAALRLWEYLVNHHLHESLLNGPDPVGRINGRVWRFVKNYLPAWRVNDSHVFMQTQGYWIIANWILFEATGEGVYRATALACSNAMLALQRADGVWDYPCVSYERIGLVATVEGVWARLGLLATYAHEKREKYLSDLFLAMSENMKRDLINLGVEEPRIVIHHPNGVDLTRYTFNERQPETGRKITVLCVGTFEERKGIEYLIAAFATVQRHTHNVQLRI